MRIVETQCQRREIDEASEHAVAEAMKQEVSVWARQLDADGKVEEIQAMLQDDAAGPA